MANKDIAYLRTEDAPILPPPINDTGLIGWFRKNIFSFMSDFSSFGAAMSSIFYAVLTFGLLYIGFIMFWGLLDFTVFSAVFNDPEGLKRGVCTTIAQGGVAENTVGACWPYVKAKWQLFIYGRYPSAELWRVDLVFIILAVGVLWLIWEKAPFRKWVALFMLTTYPIIALVLLGGGNAHYSQTSIGFFLIAGVALYLAGVLGLREKLGEVLLAFGGGVKVLGLFFLAIGLVMLFLSLDYGLEEVATDRWGGLMLTLVVALTGIVASLPIGIVLALGRRSKLPLFRILSVAYIEFWRGVPLISVLFMSSVMLPLFLPEGTEFDKLLRALIGVALFSSAYMAEVVRGGLQAISKGQYEGAQALGLNANQTNKMIILPQALKIVIPGIVNTFIGLFKDTTLVLIIGLFDLLGIIQNTFADANWATPTTSMTGYLVAGFIFWLFCFGMSRYSIFLEDKLHTGHKR